jgi:hypothetical protein
MAPSLNLMIKELAPFHAWMTRTAVRSRQPFWASTIRGHFVQIPHHSGCGSPATGTLVAKPNHFPDVKFNFQPIFRSPGKS